MSVLTPGNTGDRAVYFWITQQLLIWRLMRMKSPEKAFSETRSEWRRSAGISYLSLEAVSRVSVSGAQAARST